VKDFPPFIGHFIEDELASCYSQHDATTAYTDHVFQDTEYVPRLNNVNGNLATTDLVYCMWGAMKKEFFKDSPETLFELYAAVANFIKIIQPTKLSRVFTNKRENISKFYCNLSKYSYDEFIY
jgi:hypothetical protein